jgi:hypothetical protein
MTEPNVAFVSTNYGPLWSPVVESWLQVVGYTSRHFAITHCGKLGGAGVTDRLYTHSAENGLVKDLLTHDFTHIFMTEADMVLPHDCVVKLLAMDKDMASGVYFLRADRPEHRGQPCLYKKAAAITAEQAKEALSKYYHTPITLFPQADPFRVDCAGLGCVLIKRNVLETLPYPWFDLKAGDKEQNLVGYGSDIYFYTHARAGGFELWVDPTVQCGQIDYYITTISDYQWQLDNNPKFAGAGFVIGIGEDARLAQN